MKRRWPRNLMLVIGILIAALLLTPFLIGLYARTQIISVINRTTSPFAIRAQVVSYQPGWFISHMHLKIFLANPTYTSLEGDVSIYNGPLILFLDWRHQSHWYLSYFAAKGDFKVVDPHLDQLLHDGIPEEIFIAIRQNLHLNSIIHVHIPEFTIIRPDQTRTDIGGITFHLFHSRHHNHIRLHGLLNDVSIDSPSLRSRLTVQYAALNLDINRDKTGLWTGITKITTPLATFADQLGSAKLTNIQLVTQTNHNDPKNLFNLTFDIQKIALIDSTIGPFVANATIRHFYDADLGNFMAIQKFVCEMNLPKDLRDQALDPFVTQLLQGVTAHLNQATLQSNFGTIDAKANFVLPQINANIRPLPTVSSMFHASQLDAKLIIPAAALKLSTTQANLLQATLLGYFQQGWLVKTGDHYTLRLTHDVNGYKINGTPWLQKSLPQH